MTGTLEYDPYAPELQRDPYPAYRWLREHDPVHHVAGHDFWVLTRYDDAVAAASDTAMTSTLGLSQLDPFPAEGELPPYAHSIATMDPPDHTQLRRMVQSIFGTKHLRAWVPRIEPIAERLVTEVLDAGDDADIARQLAVPLPADVITELMGLPTEDRDRLVRWSDEVTAILPGVGKVGMDAAIRGGEAGAELAAYAQEFIDERRRRPREDDLISAMIAVRDPDTGRQLDPDQVIGHVVTMILAGLETTESLVANMGAALLQHPDQLERLRREPDLIPGAVEESLRWETPAQGTFRTALREVTIGGTVIPENARVQLAWGSANRDEERFPDGERFLVDRKRGTNLAFGVGFHFCLGAFLARAEARVLFEQLLARTRVIDPAGEPRLATDRMPVVRKYTRVPISTRGA